MPARAAVRAAAQLDDAAGLQVVVEAANQAVKTTLWPTLGSGVGAGADMKTRFTAQLRLRPRFGEWRAAVQMHDNGRNAGRIGSLVRELAFRMAQKANRWARNLIDLLCVEALRRRWRT
jgi:glucose-6-phosphate dehydrogenase assembly protein OpcA